MAVAEAEPSHVAPPGQDKLSRGPVTELWIRRLGLSTPPPKFIYGYRGESMTKEVAPETRVQAIPFIAGVGRVEYSRLGIGLQFPDQEDQVTTLLFYGPQNPIRAWRATQLLGLVDRFDPDILRNVWEITGTHIHSLSNTNLDELASKNRREGLNKLEFYREYYDIRRGHPSNDELKAMVKSFYPDKEFWKSVDLRKNVVEVDTWEIAKLVNTGQIESGHRINKLIAENWEMSRRVCDD